MASRTGKDMSDMIRTKNLLVVALIGAGTAACTPVVGEVSAVNNPTLYSVHQPVVQRTDFVFDVRAGDGGVAASEQARLDAWFSSIDLRYGDSITIDEAPGYPSAQARTDIASVAGRYGLLLRDGPPVTPGAIPPGTVRVIASRATASVPSCPAWNNMDIAPVNTTSSNFGCATNSNLAAMIADPGDLIVGRDGAATQSAVTATRAIRGYREGAPTGRQGLQQSSTTQGAQ